MLTDAAIKALKPQSKMYKVSDRDGMYVRVMPSGAISFRHRRFTGTSLEHATLKLGDCSLGGIGPGVTCMTQLIMDPAKAGAAPQNRPIGFARVNGRWEVAVW